MLDADNKDNIKIAFEKVLVMGYAYSWFDKKHNLSITRIGPLSSPYLIPFNGNPYMFIDVETHPGMSGSPVFMIVSNYMTQNPDGSNTINLGITNVGTFSGQQKLYDINKETRSQEKVKHS